MVLFIATRGNSIGVRPFFPPCVVVLAPFQALRSLGSLGNREICPSLVMRTSGIPWIFLPSSFTGNPDVVRVL